MNLFLTGGTGFFGRSLLRYWTELSNRGGAPPTVTVLTRDPEKFLANHPLYKSVSWVRFVRGDILIPETIPNLSGVSHVLHAAADSTPGPQLTHRLRFQQIVEGTRHMLDWSVRCGVRRFLLCSSGGVYGATPVGVTGFDEAYAGMPDPLLSSNCYGVGKRAAEHLCSLYSNEFGLEVVIARCFAFVGPDLPLNAHFAIGNFIRDALWADEIRVNGDGTPIRSYLHQDDLAHWLMTILDQGESCRAYNVGSDVGVSMRDLAETVRRIVSPAKPIKITGAAALTGAGSRYLPSITRARNELGLAVRIDLDQAIFKTLISLRDVDSQRGNRAIGE